MARLLLLLVALLAVLAVATVWQAGRKARQAHADYPPIGQFVEVDGARIHAVVTGDGPDLVLIHGSNANVRDFTTALVPRLAARYRVFVFDRPGLGYSDPADPDGASISRQAALLAAAARELGADRPIVLGQSYGGAVALAWALNHPGEMSALVAVSAASNPWDTGLDPFYKLTSHPVAGPPVIAGIAAWVPASRILREMEAVFAPQPVPDYYVEDFGIGLTLRYGSLRANALQRANLLAEIEAQVPRYGEIDVPVEIVHGTADRTVSIDIHSRPLARQIPGAVLTELPGIGHMPQHSAVDDVIAAIDRAAARAGLPLR